MSYRPMSSIDSDVSDYDSESTSVTPVSSKLSNNSFVFRLDNGPEAVRMALLERGWIEFEEGENEEHEWNLWWKTTRFRLSDYNDILPWQRINHFPKTTAITKKDSLSRTMRRMRGVYGVHVYNFTPVGFNLPNDYTKYVAEYTKMKQNSEEKEILWICKPADLSRGRGIFIFRDLKDLQYDCSAVVQQYINNPLLISGYKFDLRIYVNVSCFHPLNIYIYKEGLVRFGTEKFDLTTLDNRFSHLTNTSINKLSPSYTTDKERVGPGCKWSLTTLRNYFHQQNIDDSLLWQRISNIVNLTILAQVQSVPKISNCFELFGFDILIDENMKPWLLEVNFSPALGVDCPIDQQVKKPMLNDLIDMLSFTEKDSEKGGEAFRANLIRQTYGRPNNYGLNYRKTNNTSMSPRKKTSVSSTHSGSRLPSISKNVVEDRRSPSRSSSKGASSASSRGGNTDTASNEKTYKGVATVSTTKTASHRKPGTIRRDYRGGRTRQTTIGQNKLSNETKVSVQSDGAISTKSSNSMSHALSLPDIDESKQHVENHCETLQSHKENQHTSGADSSLHVANYSRSSTFQETDMHPKQSSSAAVVIPHPPDKPPNRYNRAQTHMGMAQKTQYHISGKFGSNIPAQQRSTGNTVSGAKTRMSFRQRPMADSLSNLHSKGVSRNRPPPTVGDFILAFPPTETLRRSSYPALDMRTIIRELQKQLKQSIIASKKGQTVLLKDFNSKRGERRGEEVIKWEPMHPKATVSC
ncbi:uncharacterized protein LOC100373878 [Saccoglossus kowalevskii]|uniref:Uncharacterized protein LOC100373878 n=1 Tax=Saccoglossus kowalevskii TaxID=10224 RepID=A0ABM0GVZ6_SACKO|nr:PREDICTED: uncharacterized protein LOC100373878 [Saccoglossus kowalevskii]